MQRDYKYEISSLRLTTFSSKTNTSQFSVSQQSLRHSSLDPRSISFKYFAPMSLESCVLIILSVWISKLFIHVCKSISPLFTILLSRPSATREIDAKLTKLTTNSTFGDIFTSFSRYAKSRSVLMVIFLRCGFYQLWLV